MVKLRRRLFSFIMVLVVVVAFAVPMVSAYPSSAGISSVTVYPAKYAAKQYYYQYPTTSYSPSGRDQILNVTLDSNARSAYTRNNCDAFYVSINVNTGNAMRYELYEDNT